MKAPLITEQDWRLLLDWLLVGLLLGAAILAAAAVGGVAVWLFRLIGGV